MSVYADGCGRIRLVRGDSGALTVSCETLEGEPRPFAAGERVAQLVVMPYLAAAYEEAETLSDTVRGAGGFGSTGRN